MATEYEKGVAVLRFVRSGESDWIQKVLRVREGEIAMPQFEDITHKSKDTEAVTEVEAKRALEWADAIWLSERTQCDEKLIEAVEERNRAIREIESRFHQRISEIAGQSLEDPQLQTILETHSARVSESQHRKAALGSLWSEINRERLLSQARQLRRAQGSISRPADSSERGHGNPTEHGDHPRLD